MVIMQVKVKVGLGLIYLPEICPKAMVRGQIYLEDSEVVEHRLEDTLVTIIVILETLVIL